MVRVVFSARFVPRIVCVALLLLTSSASAADAPLKVAFLVGEDEYQTEITLPKFAKEHLEPLGVQEHVHLRRREESLSLSRHRKDRRCRRALRLRPSSAAAEGRDCDAIRNYLKSGKPLVAHSHGEPRLCHAAEHEVPAGKEPPKDLDQWPEFDVEVLGGKYENHYGNDDGTDVAAASHAQDHPILTGVRQRSFHSGGTLYKCTANKGPTVLMNGITTDNGKPVTHPVLWTNHVRQVARRSTRRSVTSMISSCRRSIASW